jgi:hypothetical protein
MAKDMNTTAVLPEEDIDLELKKLQLAQLRKSLTEDAEKKRIEKVARESVARDMERGRVERLNFQANCTHKKDNGMSAIAGQKVSNGSGVYVCQNCFAPFTDKTIPRNAIPSAIAMAGTPEQI